MACLSALSRPVRPARGKGKSLPKASGQKRWRAVSRNRIEQLVGQKLIVSPCCPAQPTAPQMRRDAGLLIGIDGTQRESRDQACYLLMIHDPSQLSDNKELPGYLNPGELWMSCSHHAERTPEKLTA